MKFSVAMGVYHRDNATDFIKAVESVTSAQSCVPNEVIIVVDGPIYGQLNDAVKRFEQNSELFKVIWLKKNVGHAGARQAGLKAATNEWVAIMDSDDIAVPNRFEKQIKYLESHPNCDIIGGQISEFIDTPDNIVGERIVPINDQDIKTYLKSRCPMNLVCVMYRKTAVESVGGFIDWFCEEDYYLWIRMAEANCQFANLPDTLVNVRVGKEMYQRRGGWKYFISEKKLQEYMLKRKIISLPRYAYNVIGRFAIQVAMPNKLRGLIFQKLFRK